MVGDAFHKRKIPWATLVWVFCATLCQVLVLVGNCSTAKAMNALGVSTGGWAMVGRGVARSLQIELDYELQKVSDSLIDGLEHLGIVQDALDTVLSLLPGDLSLRFREHPRTPDEATSLLQEHQEVADPAIGAGLALLVRDSVHKAVSAVVAKVSAVLRKLLELLRPALVRIGEWLVRFGDKVQAGISIFSVTLDRVQKLLDHIMSQLAGRGENEQAMVDETFGLFDVSQTGYVTRDDLRDVAELYRITALQGNVPDKLTVKYDASGDGKLDKHEMALLANDEQLPNLLSAVLRTYGKRLSEISGHVAAARQRDEIAQAVVDYVALVCSKNQTKVLWIADRLGNGSLPMAFTADVMAEVCLTQFHPDRAIASNTAQALISSMYRLHPEYTLQSFELMSNTSFWASAGFFLSDQPDCVGRVTAWIANAAHTKAAGQDSSTQEATHMSMQGMLSVLSDAHRIPVDRALLHSFPGRARRLVKESVTLYSLERREGRSRRLRELNSSQAPRLMAMGLYGSVQPGDMGSPSSGEQAVSNGQQAANETLEFAEWLARNSSETAARMHDMCFAYSSESSGVVDSHAAEIQQMVGQVQAFLDSMMKYATPSGLQRLEDQIEAFESKAVRDLVGPMEKKLFALVNKSLPTLELMVGTAAHKAGVWIGQKASKLIEGPLGNLLADPLASYIAQLVQSEKAAKALSLLLGPDMAKTLANLTADTLAETTGQLLEALVETTLEHGADLVNSSVSRAVDHLVDELDDLIPTLVSGASMPEAQVRRAKGKKLLASFLQAGANASRPGAAQARAALARRADEGAGGRHAPRSTLDAMKSKYADEFEVEKLPEWGDIVDAVQSLSHALPNTMVAVKSARREVAKVSSNLESAFMVLENRGRPLFDAVARFWRTLWILYFCSLIPLHCYILYYGFWAGGFFGGPTPLSSDEEMSVEPPKSFAARVNLCMESCSVCMKKYHDRELCFWSVVLLLQVVVLVLFLVSILLCAVSGIRAFVLAGCTQMYVLGDESVCRDTLANLRDFLGSFFIRDAIEPLYGACGYHNLLTCQLIANKMITSGILTTVFSVLGTVFGLHLVVNSAVLHEQARWRRLAAAAMRDSAEEDIDAGSIASIAPSGP